MKKRVLIIKAYSKNYKNANFYNTSFIFKSIKLIKVKKTIEITKKEN